MPTFQEAENYVIRFGQYRGKKIKDIGILSANKLFCSLERSNAQKIEAAKIEAHAMLYTYMSNPKVKTSLGIQYRETFT